MSTADTKVSGTGEALGHAAIVHGLVLEPSGTAGSIEVRDGGASSTVQIDVPVGGDAGTVMVNFEGGGIQFTSTVHVSTLSNINNATFIYEDVS